MEDVVDNKIASSHLLFLWVTTAYITPNSRQKIPLFVGDAVQAVVLFLCEISTTILSVSISGISPSFSTKEISVCRSILLLCNYAFMSPHQKSRRRTHAEERSKVSHQSQRIQISHEL